MLGRRKALFYEKLPDKKVKCKLCPRNCILSPGQLSFCKVRKNIDGELYTLNYGIISALGIDPIEKKPLFHFYPGSPIFSISTFGCNFKCPWCQNWEISQSEPNLSYASYYPPEDLIKLVKKYRSPSIAYTYNEPIIWYEYVLETSKLAKKEGIMNVLVTNGHICMEPLEELIPYIDAVNVDIKAFSQDVYSKYIKGYLEAVLEAIEEMKKKGVHVETTYLVIPGVNDREEEFRKMIRWHLDRLGDDTPLHISRFFPHYKFLDTSPTPTETLERLWKVAQEEGVKYVYVGNLPGHRGENTYCPSCQRAVIKRIGFAITEWNLSEDNRCKFCGAEINIRGRKWKEVGGHYWWLFI